MNTVSEVIAALGGQERTTVREAFIPTRFPYTYAYDYLRGDCNVKRPDGSGPASRADCAAMLADYCDEQALNVETVCMALAYRYMQMHGVVKP